MGTVNIKKNIRLKNRTLYFDPGKDKTHVTFGSPRSYCSRQSKIEGYESRLFWQFKYCQDFDGQTFYYTLTYNNQSIPYHYGTYCFDYEHLRDLLTGGFRKVLLRKYGTTFKYFIGAELGDGKGRRGFHNNPHYHVLFFLESANSSRFPYIKINSLDFRHLVRLYWQGFDEDVTGWRSYKTAKYGAVKEGDNLGLVTDFRACTYCAKYVCKDAGLVMHEEKVERFLRYKYRQDLLLENSVWCDFFHSVVYDKFNTPLNATKTAWCWTDEELLIRLCPKETEGPLYVFGEVPLSDLVIRSFTGTICSKFHLWNDFNQFVNGFVDVRVKEGLNEWRNRFCNKCRISHGVGDYALRQMDKLDPVVSVPSKNGFKNRPICLYYHRKLYYDVVKPVKNLRNGKEVFYSPVRVLNDDGIEFKVHRLKSAVERSASQASAFFNLVCSDKELFEKMKASDVNTEVTCSFETFKRISDDLFYRFGRHKGSFFEGMDVFHIYSYFKLVYQDRFFKVSSIGDSLECSFPLLSPFDDYRFFLRSSYYFVDRNELMLDSFLESGCQGYLPYSAHPDFLSYSVFFSVLDLCTDYFFVQNDNEAQRKAEEIKRIKQYHDQRKLKQYYYGTTVF